MVYQKKEEIGQSRTIMPVRSHCARREGTPQSGPLSPTQALWHKHPLPEVRAHTHIYNNQTLNKILTF